MVAYIKLLRNVFVRLRVHLSACVRACVFKCLCWCICLSFCACAFKLYALLMLKLKQSFSSILYA